MMTFGEKVIAFHKRLTFNDNNLPFGIKIMNPYQSDQHIISYMERFYNKYYNDNNPRNIILGINPGRLGAGATGIPFTDTKRLSDVCGIDIDHLNTHEPSSVFIYDLIGSFGGVKKFYNKFYIGSVCPLGFIKQSPNANWINCNYYDFPELYDAMKEFMISSLKSQISFGIKTEKVFVLGKENAKWLNKINAEEKLFSKVVILEHPRYIMQYKLREKEKYISKFLEKMK